MMHKAWKSIEEVTYCFSRSYVKLQGHKGKKSHQILPQIGDSRLKLHFDFLNGYEMMQKSCSSIEEVPYCFSMSSVKFQDHMGQKIVNFDPHWVFPGCNSSLNSLMDLK